MGAEKPAKPAGRWIILDLHRRQFDDVRIVLQAGRLGVDVESMSSS